MIHLTSDLSTKLHDEVKKTKKSDKMVTDILKELKAKKLVDKMLGKKSGSDLQKEPKGY